MFIICYSLQPREVRAHIAKQRSHQINVIFHVLVSKDMIDDPKDKVLIKFSHDSFGGWTSNKHEMTLVGYVETIKGL